MNLISKENADKPSIQVISVLETTDVFCIFLGKVWKMRSAPQGGARSPHRSVGRPTDQNMDAAEQFELSNRGAALGSSETELFEYHIKRKDCKHNDDHFAPQN